MVGKYGDDDEMNDEHGTCEWNMEHGTWNMEHGTWNIIVK
jgi:hypothetical protein